MLYFIVVYFFLSIFVAPFCYVKTNKERKRNINKE